MNSSTLLSEQTRGYLCSSPRNKNKKKILWNYRIPFTSLTNTIRSNKIIVRYTRSVAFCRACRTNRAVRWGARVASYDPALRLLGHRSPGHVSDLCVDFIESARCAGQTKKGSRYWLFCPCLCVVRLLLFYITAIRLFTYHQKSREQLDRFRWNVFRSIHYRWRLHSIKIHLVVFLEIFADKTAYKLRYPST